MFQLLRIVVAFICGLIVSGLFLSWGFFQASYPNDDPVAFAAMIGSGLVGASVLGAGAFVPASIAIAIAEIARLRSLIFFLAAGGGIAFLMWTLGEAEQAQGLRPGSVIALAAGFLAGSVYWLVAGRTSGCWRTSLSGDLPSGGPHD
ncbi:translation initiation factor IF-3 [Rhodobacterales bacterium]|nr:translation initiation factor IF-3 [Rhodobacterales bacterium]